MLRVFASHHRLIHVHSSSKTGISECIDSRTVPLNHQTPFELLVDLSVMLTNPLTNNLPRSVRGVLLTTNQQDRERGHPRISHSVHGGLTWGEVFLRGC